MKKLSLNLRVASLLAVFVFFPITSIISAVPIHAQNLVCRIFPFLNAVTSFGISSICGNLDGTQAATQTYGLIQLVLNLIFIGIIIVSIYIIIKAAVKYIQSEGDDKKIQEAQKAIKSVFIGIAALFIGIIGIILVLAFFNATGAVNNANPLPNNDLLRIFFGGNGATPTPSFNG